TNTTISNKGIHYINKILKNSGSIRFYPSCDHTKVQIGERQTEEGQVLLLESTRGRVIPLAGVNEQGDQHDNVEDVEPRLNEESGDDAVADQTEESDRAVQYGKVNIVVDGDVQVAVFDKPKGARKKRKATGGASERSTLAAEVGVTAATTVPFVTSSVTLTPEREGGGHTNSVSGPNLQTRHPAERFVISSDSSHHSSTNAADDEFTSIVRSFASPPPIMTVAVAATTVAGTSTAPALGAGTELVHARIFNDSASIGEAGQDVTDPSNPAKLELSVDTFYVS
nr:hypothetical protein [Tanacetum cinerariifolium]